MRRTGLALAVLLASAAVSFAAPLSIPNSSFEAGLGYGGVWGGEPANWNHGEDLGGNPGASTVLQVVTDTTSGYITFAGKDGANYLFIRVDGGQTVNPATSTNSIWTNSLGTYAADTTYTLSVALATVANYSPNRSATIALLADGSVVQSNVLPFMSLSSTTFQDFTVALDTQALPSVLGKSISVSITQTLSNEQYGKDVAVDNVRLDAFAVPEPATMGLLAAGSLLALRRRRRSLSGK